MLRSLSPTGEIAIPPSERECENAGDRLVNLALLRDAAMLYMRCPQCQCSMTVHEECGGRRHGVATYLAFRCINCTFEHCFGDPRSSSSKALNTRVVLGSRLCGLGRTGAYTMCSILGLPPPFSKSSFDDTAKSMNAALATMADMQQREAAVELKHKLGHNPDDVVDVMVTCDCTWSKRGFTAPYGVVAVISWFTGHVLDCEVLCKVCSACSHWDGRDHTSDEYKKWYEKHKPKCPKNFDGSSPAMESEGVRRLWARSEARLGLRYTEVICNGDSKAYDVVSESQPYPGIQIVKHECVGHVQKRVGKQLHALKKDETLKYADGTRPIFNRRLTNANIAELQKCYGDAIRKNVGVGDSKAMIDACWAVFYHSCSTDENPRHHYCPDGKDSSCDYNRALAEGRVPSHSKPPRIPPDLVEFVADCWAELCDPDLLERCTLGATQNQNESFNSIVWKYCHKTDFSGLVTVRTATYLASLTFNKGMTYLLPLFKS